ncbi:MAG: hypothetical protein ACRED0_03350 [Gammaproteobacteria bacterium]
MLQVPRHSGRGLRPSPAGDIKRIISNAPSPSALAGFAVPVSRGAITLLDKAGLGAHLQLEAAAVYVDTHNTNFGSGRVDRLFGEGTYWLTPRKAFERAALLKTHSRSLRADLFYLTSNADQDLTELVGFNLGYLHAERGTMGLMYLKVLDAYKFWRS